MSKRDLIREILEKKERTSYEWLSGSLKLYDVENSYRETKAKDITFGVNNSLFVVGIVSCVEISVRTGIKRLVDHGMPYTERLDRFKDFLKFDLSIAKALKDKKVSFGELISHLLPVKNIGNIIDHFGVLFADSFSSLLSEIREFKEPKDSDILGYDDTEQDNNLDEDDFEPRLLISDVNAIFANITKLFSKRHIIAHEAVFDSVKEVELEEYFTSARVFVDALEELIEQTLNPNKPRFAFLSSIVEANEASEVYEKMEQKFNELHSLVSDEQTFYDSDVTVRKQLKITQDKFLEYMESETSFVEALIKPMSGNTLRSIDSQVQKEFCEHRIKVIDEHLKWVKEDF
jgi:predicted CopG family antitoxin